jgi:hypothetical protein
MLHNKWIIRFKYVPPNFENANTAGNYMDPNGLDDERPSRRIRRQVYYNDSQMRVTSGYFNSI